LQQRRYQEALDAYAEAREKFTRLDEPGSVAVSWHMTRRAYQEAGYFEAAEDAYRQSLALKVRLEDVRGQATTLAQLGNLYASSVGLPEQAVAFFKQAADKCIELGDEANEGRTRTNLANALRNLGRFEEARAEIQKAIEIAAQFGHAAEPWTSWAILAGIEVSAGNSAAADAAKRKAVEHYLAYRRDGGENHYPDGRLSLAVTGALLTGGAAASDSTASGTDPGSGSPGGPAFVHPGPHRCRRRQPRSRARRLA
jgi:tetratricopeptide (TPR) repeat protein